MCSHSSSLFHGKIVEICTRTETGALLAVIIIYYHVKHSFIQIKTKTVLLYGLIHWKRSPPAQRHRCSLYIGQLSSLLVHVVSHFDDFPEIADQIMVIVQVLV